MSINSASNYKEVMTDWSIQGGPLDLQLPMQSVPTTSNAVRLNPVHGEMYLIQH